MRVRKKPESASPGHSWIVRREPIAEERIGELRIMLVRGEIEEAARLAEISPEALGILELLLRDELVTVPAGAADAIAMAASRGCDVSHIEASLAELMEAKYYKRNSARALMTIRLIRGDDRGSSELLISENAEIREGAMQALREAAGKKDF